MILNGYTTMLRRTVLALLITVVLNAVCGAVAQTSRPPVPSVPGRSDRGSPRPLGPAVDAYLTNLVKAQAFSGTVLIARRGTILFTKGYGLADADHHRPNTPQTQFRLASITKQFTALAILLLQERGKLHVRDHICPYLAGCPTTWRPITIHQCLTHTSGIPDVDPASVTAATADRLITLVQHEPLAFTPGTQFGYSSAGYVVLGAIIAKAAGEPYAAFIQRHIFDPLHMRHTGFDRTNLRLAHRAIGYATSTRTAAAVNVAFANAAWGLYATVADLYRWDEALGTPKLLSGPSWAALFTPHVSPCAGGACITSSAFSVVGYGYGWVIPTVATHRLVFHGGRMPGVSTYNGRYLDDKVSIIVLSNLDAAAAEDTGLAIGALMFARQ